ncbi:hypothetical protein [Haloferula sp. BvORR071]|uniref:hypothetical protein n=1 Tax=Haloferula sp. BvORR071 TaxID=1396141 RepID=UPI00055005D7|nr:hypothetical protein [Haloferula sp. BvORR071]
MKRNLLIGAIVLPLAFFAGRIGGGSPDSVQTPAKTAAPTKAGDRTAESRRGAGKSGSPAWSILRRRAGMSTDELLEDLFVGGANQFDSWRIDQMLATDPERLFREIYRRADGGMLAEVTRRWCTTDPERALPLLLGKKEPFAWKGRDFYDPRPPVSFTAMGALDPEKGLAMIDALPASQLRERDYSTLLEGVASAEPGKALDCFERILAKGEPPANQLGWMVQLVASADPQAALNWAKGQYDPVPAKLMASLLEGMSKNDPAGSASLYEETSPKPGGSALYQIQVQLARKSSDLDATWQWVERNVEPANLAGAKAQALVAWARKNPDAAMGRLLPIPT